MIMKMRNVFVLTEYVIINNINHQINKIRTGDKYVARGYLGDILCEIEIK